MEITSAVVRNPVISVDFVKGRLESGSRLLGGLATKAGLLATKILEK